MYQNVVWYLQEYAGNLIFFHSDKKWRQVWQTHSLLGSDCEVWQKQFYDNCTTTGDGPVLCNTSATLNLDPDKNSFPVEWKFQ